MDAKEARRQAEENNNTKATGNVAEILKLIEKAVNNGLFETWYHKSLNSLIIKTLEAEGYKVTDLHENIRNEHGYHITW